MTSRPAIFLDRDGVIIEHRDTYVRQWRDAAFLPRSLGALAQLDTSALRVFIITNQSIIGRGEVSAETVREINERIIAVVRSHGGQIDAAYTCPHTPQDHCACRKPQPGLLMQAAGEFALDLPRSVVIGDALTDLQAGAAAGVGLQILVATGRGTSQAALLTEASLPNARQAADLADALDLYLSWLGSHDR